MKYEDFDWNIEKDIKMLINYANDKFKGEDREWTIEILYWRDEDRMIELRSEKNLVLDIIRFHKGSIKYFQKQPKSSPPVTINVIEVINTK